MKKRTIAQKKHTPKTDNSIEEMKRKNREYKSKQEENLRTQGSTTKMKTPKSNDKEESTIQEQQRREPPKTRKHYKDEKTQVQWEVRIDNTSATTKREWLLYSTRQSTPTKISLQVCKQCIPYLKQIKLWRQCATIDKHIYFLAHKKTMSSLFHFWNLILKIFWTNVVRE